MGGTLLTGAFVSDEGMRIVGMFSNVDGYTAARDTLAGISRDSRSDAGLLLIISGCQFGGNSGQVAEQTC